MVECPARIETEDAVIIVTGWLRVAPGERAGYLAGCRDVVLAARSAPGCRDFHLSADPLELDRVNVVERWDTVDDVEAFRGSGPSGAQQAAIIEAEVVQYEVRSAERL
jgi:quinol monooxygenase YgiN